MRALLLALTLAAAPPAAADWRADVVRAALSGNHATAVALAEAGRAPWLAPHIATVLPPPDAYLGWVVGDTHLVAYLAGDAPAARAWRRPPSLESDLAAVRAALARRDPVPAAALARLRAALVEPVADWLAGHDAWVIAPGDALAAAPWPLLLERPHVLAHAARSAALSAHRVRRARERPPTLLAYARDAPGDPRALPHARAEIEFAAGALGADATLLHGVGALAALRTAAYDGTLADARFVLIAAHADARAGTIGLDLAPGPGGRYTPGDTLHLQFGAELVVLSACETASDARFAHAAILAGVGQTLLTQWRVDDAATAQFVGAVFHALGHGATAPDAVARVRRAFAAGHHGAEYTHPFYWAGWVVWGGL